MCYARITLLFYIITIINVQHTARNEQSVCCSDRPDLTPSERVHKPKLSGQLLNS